MSLPSTIAVDGPAASGKSTIGGLLAEKLGHLYFDTGALYRAITWLALERGLEIGDQEAIVALAQAARITITRPTVQDGRQYTVCVDSRDITWEIRSTEVDAHVSPVSAYPGVREALKAAQRQIGEEGQVVMVGRDIGTVILPRADLKVYLDASLQVRAQRRYEEVLGRGEEASFEEIFADMRRRDEIDSHRLAAPLKPAEEAIVIDTDHLSIEEVLGQVMALVEKWQSLEEGANR